MRELFTLEIPQISGGNLGEMMLVTALVLLPLGTIAGLIYSSSGNRTESTESVVQPDISTLTPEDAYQLGYQTGHSVGLSSGMLLGMYGMPYCMCA